MLILYDGTTSVCAIKARLVLAEKGISFESRNVDLRKGEQFSPEYLSINPNAVVPTLFDNELKIIESSIIMQYLEDIAPNPSLLPKDAMDRARVRLWLKRVDESVHPSIGTLTHGTAFRPSFLNKTAEEQKAHLEKIPDPGRRARQEAVYRDGFDAAIVIQAIKVFDSFITDVEAALNTTEFLVGNNYTLADAAITPYINRIRDLKLLSLWEDISPNVLRWFEQISLRQSFSSSITDYLTEVDKNQFSSIDGAVVEKANNILKN